MAVLFDPLFTVDDANGKPISGAMLRFYLSGTNTGATIYSDGVLSTPLSNPVIADSAGRFPSVYLDENKAYRAEICDASGTVIRGVDPVANAALTTADLATVTSTAAASAAATAAPYAAAASASSVSAAASAVNASLYEAAALAAANGNLFSSTANAISKGVLSTSTLVGGSGGANGSFPLAFSGGGGSGAAGVFQVAGGIVTQITITSKGVGYTSAPTISFAASSGLTGASATAVIGNRTNDGDFFLVVGSGNTYASLYKNVSGTATAQSLDVPSLAALLSYVATIEQDQQTLDARQDLIRHDRVELSTYYDPPTGTKYTGSSYSGYFSTHLIACSGFSNIYVQRGATSSITGVVFFNRAGTRVGSVTSFPTTLTTIAVPAGATSFALSANKTVYGDAFAANNVDPEIKIYGFDPGAVQERSYGRFQSRAELNRWNGKKIVFLGDSRVKNDTYNFPKRVCRDVGATLGLADGSGYSDTSKAGRVFDKALYRADDSTVLSASDFTDVDAVFIQIGINNLLGSPNPGDPANPANIAARIGAWTDAAGTLSPAGVAGVSTMCAKMRTIIATLISWKPAMRIIPVSPFYRNDVVASFGLTQTQVEMWLMAWRDELKKLCDTLSLPMFDHWAKSGINRYNYGTYLDGTQLHQTTTPADQTNGYSFGNVNQYTDFLRYDVSPAVGMVPFERVP